MKTVFKVNDEKTVVVTSNGAVTEVFIESSGVSTSLITIPGPGLLANIVCNEDYIVVYMDQENKVVNKIAKALSKYEIAEYPTLLLVYDMKEEKKIELSSDGAKMFENMYVKPKSFGIDIVLTALNGGQEIGLQVDDDELSDFYAFVTSANPAFTDDDVKTYIISCYPGLEEYIVKKKKIKIPAYKNVIKEFGEELSFYAIRQKI